MGIRNFFSKMGQGLVKAGRWVGNKVVDGAKWVGKHAKPILQGVLNTLKGSGGVIGAVANLGGNIVDSVKKSTELIPNDNVRNKANEFIDKGSAGFTKIVDKAKDISERAQPYADAAQKLLDM